MGFLDDIGGKFTSAMTGLGDVLGGDHSDILDNLNSVWGELSDFAGGADSKMAEYAKMLEDKEKMVSDLKSKNYDLLMASPGTDPSDAAGKQPGEEGAADYDGVTFDDLISTSDKKGDE